MNLMGIAVVASLLGQSATPVLTLDEALRKAESQGLDLAVTKARLQQSRQQADRAWSGYLPQVSVAGNITRNNVSAGFTLPPALGGTGEPVIIQQLIQRGAQLQARQTLLSPALLQAIRTASLAEGAAEINAENARREVLFAVAQSYLGAAALKQAVAVQQRQLEVQTAQAKNAEVRYSAGALNKVALLRAQIDRAQAEQDLERSKNSYASALVSLATLLNEPKPFEVDVPPEPNLPASLENLEAGALENRPDVSAARVGLKVAESARAGAYWGYAPSLGVTGQYQYSNVTGFTGLNYAWFVQFGLQWNIFDGGLREAEIRETRARVVEARAQRQQAENNARADVRRSLLELSSARANRTKAQEQLSLARENQRLVEVNYRAGAATYLEVTDANAALLAAETNVVSETLNAYLASLRLLRSTGQFAASK